MQVMRGGILAVLLATTVVAAEEGTPNDAYYLYISQAPEFQPVELSRRLLTTRWDRWLYMPWRHRWPIGTGDAAGLFCREYGINGGVLDYGQGPLEWLEKWKLPFYNGHTAGKGYLFLRSHDFRKLAKDPVAHRRGPKGNRPIDSMALDQLKQTIEHNIRALRGSPLRVAYSLDDEISWGSLIRPLPWRIDSDDAAYGRWLRRYYLDKVTPAPRMMPDEALAQLNKPLREIDFAPLLDRLTYNDSVWANFIGELVRYANSIDPETPTGFTGAQAPNIWGGYDYAKLAKKAQFIEVYDKGSAQEIVRSFTASKAIPRVTTHFHRDSIDAAHDIWQAWYHFAHGNRGMIGWVEDWFDGLQPKPWLLRFRDTLRELGGQHGSKLVGAEWIHDGVAIYYSHASIQVSWLLDSEAHGKTWENRNNDDRLGTSHNVRKAWEFILTDAGIQYDFLGYDEVVVSGVPDQYKVLILPAVYALSDIEAKRVEAFVSRGGAVIADFGCGLFDQRGKGRTQGVLDELFGVEHDGTETKRDFFGGGLWVETNQDKAYDYRSYRDLFDTVATKLQDGFAIAERKLGVATVRRSGSGRSVYLNLSPQRYLQYREEGTTTVQHREVFLEHLYDAGVAPRVTAQLEPVAGLDLEVTYWCKDDRTLLFVFATDPPVSSRQGVGNQRAATFETVIGFSDPAMDLRDERTGKQLGDASLLRLPFVEHEASFLSMKGCSYGTRSEAPIRTEKGPPR